MAEIVTVQVPEGARCAVHPDAGALSLCTRCGSYACVDCTRARNRLSYCARCVELLPALASPGVRLGATVLDTLIVSVPMGLVLLGPELGPMGDAGSSSLVIVLMALGVLGMLVVGVWNLMMVHRYSQSLGKRLLHIRVVRSDGTRADLGRIVMLRNLLPGLVSAIPFIGSVFQLADALFIFRSDQRCIHDHMADTIVVDAKPDRPGA